MLIRELVHTMCKTPTFTIPKSRSFYLNQKLSYATLNANDTKVTFFSFLELIPPAIKSLLLLQNVRYFSWA